MLGNGRAAETFEYIFALFGLITQPRAAANPALALRLQSTSPAGRVAELGSLDVARAHPPYDAAGNSAHSAVGSAEAHA